MKRTLDIIGIAIVIIAITGLWVLFGIKVLAIVITSFIGLWILFGVCAYLYIKYLQNEKDNKITN